MGLFGTKINGLYVEGATGGGTGVVTSITATSPLVATPNPITATGTLSIPVATASVDGYLSSANWTTFNNKLNGAGTPNVIPKFTGAGTIGDGLLIDNTTYVQVGSFTIGANVVSTGQVNFATQNIIGSLGVYINNPASNYTKQGLFNGGNRIDFWTGGAESLRMNLAFNGYLQITKGYNNLAGSSIAVTGGINVDATNSSDYTFVNIRPTINQSNGAFTGSGQIRGFYYAPTITSLGGTTVHNAWENTSGDIVFGNLTGANTEVLMINGSGKLVKQSLQTTFNLYNGATPEGLIINYTTPSYILGNTAANRTYLQITTDSILAVHNTIADGMTLEYGSATYKFGQINGSVHTPIFLQINGTTSKAEIIHNGNGNGLLVDYTTKLFKFGDYAGNFNGTNIVIDDNANKITLDADGTGVGSIEITAGSSTGIVDITTDSIVLNGSITSLTGGGTPTDWLLLTINGVQYKIELEP